MSRDTRTNGYYNGFSAAQRHGTLAIVRAAIADGTIPAPSKCSICQQSDKPLGFHSEDYRQPLMAFPICRGCHVRVHARFRAPARWGTFIRDLPPGWYHHVSLDPASLDRAFDETYPEGVIPRP